CAASIAVPSAATTPTPTAASFLGHIILASSCWRVDRVVSTELREAALTAHPPPESKPGRPMKLPATAGIPSTTFSGRAGSRRGAGPFRTPAVFFRSNSENWHGPFAVVGAGRQTPLATSGRVTTRAHTTHPTH